MEDVNTTLQISFSLSELGCGHLHLRFNANRNIRDNVWNKAKSYKKWRSRFGAFVVVKALYTWDALQQFLHSATVWPYQSVLFCEQEVNTQLIFLSALIRPTTEEEDGGLLSNNNSIFFFIFQEHWKWANNSFAACPVTASGVCIITYSFRH